jgi:hypothetical protein
MSFFKQFPLVDYDIGLNGTINKMVNLFRSVRPIRSFVDNPSLYTYYEIKNGERPDVVSQQLYGTSEFYWTFFVINEFLHDGYKVWPMSQEQLYKYIQEEYNGYAISTRVSFIDSTIQNSIAGLFEIGETITGANSGAQGTLTKKDIDLNQLVVQNMTNSAAFHGRRDDGSATTPFESISGSKTFDDVSTHNVWPYAEAPHHYYMLDDEGVKRQFTNMSHIFDTEYAVGSSALEYVSNRQYLYDQNDERSKIRVISPNAIGEFVDKFEKLINE